MNQNEIEIAENYKCYTWIQYLFPECRKILLEEDMTSDTDNYKIE